MFFHAGFGLLQFWSGPNTSQEYQLATRCKHFLVVVTLAIFEPVSCGNDHFNREIKFCFLEAYGENEGGVQKLQLNHQDRLGFQTAAAAEWNSFAVWPAQAMCVMQNDNAVAEMPFFAHVHIEEHMGFYVFCIILRLVSITWISLV